MTPHSEGEAGPLIGPQTSTRHDQTPAWEQADLLNLTHDSIYVRDLRGTIRYWNRAAEELYGWPAEQAVGRVVHEVLKTVLPAPLEQIEAELLRTGRWEGELVHTKKDGGEVVVACRWSLQRDENGAPLAILSTNNDITERKRAEQARADLEEQWRATFESNPTMYFILDSAGAIVSVNSAGAEQLGYGVTELIGQPVLNVFYEPDRAFVRGHATACFEQPGQMVRWEARKIRKDGTMLWVRETANAVLLRKRPVLLVVCEDITEQKLAEESARGAQIELRNVIESIPAIAWRTLADGSNTFANARWTEYTGLGAEDTTGAGWQTALHPADFAGHMEKWRAAVATGRPFENEARLRRAADGTYRWFLTRGVPLRDPQGHILKWYGILLDIEDRKRAEALLSGERRILEMVARGNSLAHILERLCLLVEEHAPGVLASILLVEDGRLRHCTGPSLPSAYIEAIDGVAVGPAAGSCGTAAYLARQVIVCDIASDPLWADYRHLALAHSLRACWSTPIMSSSGTVIGTFALYCRETRDPTSRDQNIIEQITHLAGIAIQRKLTEERLQRSEAYLAEAQRLSGIGSWASNPITGKNLYWSEEMFRIWGFDPNQDLPDPEAMFQRMHPEDRNRSRELWAEWIALLSARTSIRPPTDYSDEFRIVLADGTIRHLHLLGRPVLGASGELIELVGAYADVTERKRTEQERERLRQLEDDLAHINRITVMGELAATLAHEINQPIAAAITDANACLRWLNRDPPELTEAREAALSIIADGTRAAKIIDRVRSFYKKGSPAARVPVDVNEVAREMLGLLRNEADKHSVALHTELTDLPAVMADRVQLQQVFMNLMLNGIEAMKEATGELTVRSQWADDGGILISVSDTGVGLPVGDADQVFKAFFTTKPQGIGMGLAISHSIIESHGGRLWVSGNQGRGATFQFTLPRGTGEHADIVRESHPAA